MAGPIWRRLTQRRLKKSIPDSTVTEAEGPTTTLDSRRKPATSIKSESATEKPLCPRCTKLDVHQLMQTNKPYSWWYENNSDGRHSPAGLIKEVPRRGLGKCSDIRFSEECCLCPLLRALVEEDAFDPSDELFLLPAWGIERVERSISLWWVGYKQRHLSWLRNHPEATRWNTEPEAREAEEVPAKNINYSKILYIGRKPDRQSKIGVWETFTFPHEALNALSIVEDARDSPVMGGRTVKDKIDFDVITHWLRQCELHHGIACKPRSTDTPQSIRLIDVYARVTVMYQLGMEYLCLSYVWGNVKQKGYQLGETIGQLPTTLEDAITVVKALGKQYLWVDSVCIEQHNNPQKEDQIRRMDYTYLGAWATIVALCGDSANSGLARVNSNAPRVPQLACKIEDASFVSLFPTLQQQINQSKWDKRAWTLQEGQLSARCLYFTPHQVYFECKTIQCCESVQDCDTPCHTWSNKRRLIARYDKSPQKCVCPGSFLDQQLVTNDQTRSYGQLLTTYDEYVRAYCSRELSYESDTINAITALFDDLQRTHNMFKTGFYWGLPVDALPFALLWFCSGLPQRREGFPSWSWAGWRGRLERIIDHVKTMQEGPHENLTPNNENRELTENTEQNSYFIEFQKASIQSPKLLETLYRGSPRDKDPFIDQNVWDSKEVITNGDYPRALDGHSPFVEKYSRLLFVKGFVFRCRWRFGQDSLMPLEENVYRVKLNGIACKITCYSPATMQELSKDYWGMKHMLVLHREFIQYDWCYDLLLLKWDPDIAYRISPLKISFPADARKEVFEAFNPTKACFALG